MNRRALASILIAAVAGFMSADVAAHGRWRGHGGWHGSWHHGHHGSHFGFYFGAPLFWDPYPYYYRYPQTVYVQPPPVYIQQEPTYIRRPDGYWYYCSNPAGYYPNVRSCPTGWLPVPPQP